ncbi:MULTISPECIES: hypothetical protein [unclassified Chryseobacterium]|uniref:hypothetical protein n=1 Tax=unclassified Chryseobacterium TaxID=2593645 RepID=UPI002269CAE8|nr:MULTISPECIES: hypothetical protein [unclassified Chryseobacterium]
MQNFRKFGIIPKNEVVWQEIFLIEYDINLSIDALKAMIDLQDKAYSVVDEELYKKMKATRRNNGFMEENELEQYITHLHGIEENILIELDNIQTANQIGAIFSVFENKMKMICEKLKKDFNYQFPKKEGSYIPYFWKILKGFLKEKSVYVEKYYTPIYNKYVIRNILSHQNRVAENKQFEAFKHLEEIETVESENEHYIVRINSQFCEVLLSEINIFFENLILALKARTSNIFMDLQ